MQVISRECGLMLMCLRDDVGFVFYFAIGRTYYILIFGCGRVRVKENERI